MNVSSISLLVVFVAVGYVAHPLVLPYVEDKLPEPLRAESLVADEAKELVESKSELVSQPVVKEQESKVVAEIPVVEEVTEVVVIEEEVPEVIHWDALELLKTVVSEGDVASIAYEDVQSWELGEDEELNGEVYVVGLLEITPTTIFGRKPQKVKALMQQGKVVKWVLVSTGKELQ